MDDEINLIDLYRVVRKRIRLFGSVVLLFFVMGLVYTIFAPRMYKTESVILPLGVSQMDLSNSIGVLSQLIGMPMGSGDSSINKFKLFLTSQTLTERVVRLLELDKIYFEEFWDAKNNRWQEELALVPTIERAARTLRQERIEVLNHTEYVDALILAVEDSDPERVVLISRTFLNELQRYINENIFSESKRYRLHIEEQVLANRRQLLEIGKKLSDYYQQNHISPVYGTVDVSLTSVSNLLPGESPTEEHIEDRIKSLESIKQRSEDRIKKTHIKDVPQQVYFEYLVQQKEVLQLLDGLLAQKYELAKMQEAKEDVSFQIVDEAKLPELPFKPKVKIILFLSVVGGLFIGFFLVFLWEYIAKIRASNFSAHEGARS